MRFIVLIGGCVGAVFLFSALLVQSVQQQAALAGLACASAIVPYVLFRLQSITQEHHQLARIAELLQQGNAHARPMAGTPVAGTPVAGAEGSPLSPSPADGMGPVQGAVAPPA